VPQYTATAGLGLKTENKSMFSTPSSGDGANPTLDIQSLASNFLSLFLSKEEPKQQAQSHKNSSSLLLPSGSSNSGSNNQKRSRAL
jgi:hypothetical protein